VSRFMSLFSDVAADLPPSGCQNVYYILVHNFYSFYTLLLFLFVFSLLFCLLSPSSSYFEVQYFEDEYRSKSTRGTFVHNGMLKLQNRSTSALLVACTVPRSNNILVVYHCTVLEYCTTSFEVP
jgi:hypothetical protein